MRELTIRLSLLPSTAHTSMDKINEDNNIKKAWVDCFRCHYALWKNGIEHGDISVWNLMWDAENNRGILNDWDLAYVHNSKAHSGCERTGTSIVMKWNHSYGSSYGCASRTSISTKSNTFCFGTIRSRYPINHGIRVGSCFICCTRLIMMHNHMAKIRCPMLSAYMMLCWRS
ncbi:hypothetical protein BDQ17DRAFT_1370739, partial [Cyathus striatus]